MSRDKKPKKVYPEQRRRVFVAMSGGVDSSVAALLLQNKGYDVIGVYMKGWSLTGCAEEDARDARRVAGVLNIPFYVFNFEKEFKKSVVDYMISGYAKGETPNPDIMCNKEIKFGLFLKKALALGADFVATGHYSRLRREFPISKSQFPNKIKNPNFKLFQAKDSNKDQSYFLWTLTQAQLKHCLFPLGNFTKPKVRALAKKYNLPTAEKPDSQGVCFVGEIDVAEFLKSKLGKKPGPVLTLAGKKVGVHDGLNFYTIGQRKGIGSAGGGTPYYVARKDFKKNALIVAEANSPALFSDALSVKTINWISGKAPELPLSCLARIRYRQPLQKCVIADKSKVKFNEPQRAVTPGQSAVFYTARGKMLGGAVIN